MKHLVAILSTLLLLCHLSALAEGYRLEVGHFDSPGALTVSPSGNVPLSDGCLGQVILDSGNDGIAIPSPDGRPGAGDALLQTPAMRNRENAPVTFTVNGAAYLNMPGCFLSTSVAADELPGQRVCLRVWNSTDPQSATGYWDSPLFTILPGPQQVSFARSEWCWNAFTPAASKEGIVASAELLQAYPNPFNSSSRISFSLSREEHVRLAVYDLSARLVTTLVDAPLAGGHHDLVFDGSNLPTGLYFLRLQAGHDVSQVTRLLLLR